MNRTVLFLFRGVTFEWDAAKADANLLRHGVPFELACEVFFDPLVLCCLSCMQYAMKKPYGSSRRATRPHKSAAPMSNFERIQRRLRRDRPMVAVTLRMPEDVIEDLKRVAPALGYSGYQPLMRAYVGKCLREDLAQLESTEAEALVASLRRRGIDEALLTQALTEARKGGRS